MWCSLNYNWRFTELFCGWSLFNVWLFLEVGNGLIVGGRYLLVYNICLAIDIKHWFILPNFLLHTWCMIFLHYCIISLGTIMLCASAFLFWTLHWIGTAFPSFYISWEGFPLCQCFNTGSSFHWISLSVIPVSIFSWHVFCVRRAVVALTIRCPSTVIVLWLDWVKKPWNWNKQEESSEIVITG